MNKISLARLLMSGAIVSAFAGMSVSATAQTTTEPELVNISTTEDGSKFYDKERLIETFLLDDAAELEETLSGLADDLEAAGTDLKTAQDDLAQAQTDNPDDFEAISDAETIVTDADMALKKVQADIVTKEEEIATKPDPIKKTALENELGNLKLDEEKTAATLSDANTDLTQAQTDNPEAFAALTAVGDAQGALDEVQGKADAAQTKFDAEAGKVGELVEQLDSDQVFALNRSLNNALQNKFGVDIDAEHLEMVLSGEYNKLQINALTKALESRAKFEYLADKTGNAEFLIKAETSEKKFMDKIVRFEGRFATEDAAGEAAKGAAKGVVKSAAKAAAKGAAKSAAKQAAKAAVKQAVKNNAKNAAKGKKS